MSPSDALIAGLLLAWVLLAVAWMYVFLRYQKTVQRNEALEMIISDQARRVVELVWNILGERSLHTLTLNRPPASSPDEWATYLGEATGDVYSAVRTQDKEDIYEAVMGVAGICVWWAQTLVEANGEWADATSLTQEPLLI